jgi:hypothetical protein
VAQWSPAAINLNVHVRTLIPEGIFDLSGFGRARFVPLAPPTGLAGARDED